MNLSDSNNQLTEADRDAVKWPPRPLCRCVVVMLSIGAILFVEIAYSRYHRQMTLIEHSSVTTRPVGSEWFRNLVGEERLQGFEEIRFVEFLREPTDEQLELLTRHKLVTLTLQASHLSERGCAFIGQIGSLQHFGLYECSKVPESLVLQLAKLPKLRVLELNQSRIPDSTMRQLKLLTKLETLTLRDSEFDPRLLAPLGDATHLYSLNLSDSLVTDEDLYSLRELSGLEGFLFLSGGAVTDRGLEQLKSFRKLRALSLSRTKVTDEGLTELAGMTSLNYLDLSNTAVTDAGLLSLERLSNLSALNLSGTAITSAGLSKLQTAMPECEIETDWAPLNVEPVISE